MQGIIYNEYGIEGGFDNYEENKTVEVISALVPIGFVVLFIFGGFGGRGPFGGGGGFSGGGGSSGGGGASRGF